MSRRMTWTPNILAAIEDKRQAGVSLRAIARALGCSYASLKVARAYDHRPDQRMPEAEALSRIAEAGVVARRAHAAEQLGEPGRRRGI